MFSNPKNFYIICCLLSILLGGLLGAGFGLLLPTPAVVSMIIAGVFGAALGALGMIAATEQYFIIRNSSTGYFVTQDTLTSLFGSSSEITHYTYGPGVHFCFPWERRLEENNISRVESAQEFTFSIQCVDGKLTGKGSFRLTPDTENAVGFLATRDVVDGEMQDLVTQAAIEKLSRKTVKQALGSLRLLNNHLKKVITAGDGTSEIEDRLHITIHDAIVAELLPSKDLQKTMSATAEAEAIAIGTAKLLGLTPEATQTALADGSLKRADYNEARDRFMAASGNLEGMEVKRTEFVLKATDVDPNLSEAIRAVGPAAGAIAAALSGNKSAPSGRSRGRSKPKPRTTGDSK